MINVYKNRNGMQKVLNSYNELLRMWNTEIEEQDVETSFGSTHCILAGNPQNPPLLLFHGVGDNSAVMWVLNIKELSRHFYCIAVDTLGGPGKSVPNDNYTKKTFTQQSWINEFANHYKLQSFNIAGVSNGAVMAFNYAVKERDRIEKVVCMEGGMLLNPYKAILSTIGMMFPEILLPTDKNMRKIINKLVSPESDTYERYPQIAEHIILVMRYHNQRAMFVHNLDKYDKGAALEISDKLLFLIGGYNIQNKKGFIDILSNDGFNYKVIEKAGHGINHEQPDIINEEIKGFLMHCPSSTIR